VAKISVVVNTLNEEKNLPRAIASVKNFANEIVVVDMKSEDSTVKIAKKAGAKVYSHKKTGYVEPARNWGIGKATGNWILVLDADEEISTDLGKKVKRISTDSKSADFYRVPRKNLVFGKWLKHSRWWPDYNIRLFKKGAVTWSEVIHKVPETRGEGKDLPAQERYAIIHHHYSTVTQYLERMLNYTSIQAKDLVRNGYVFSWQDLIKRPMGEFLSRFFAGEGYRDGVHGLALSLLQGFSELVLVAKVWEIQKFQEVPLNPTELNNAFSRAEYELDYWLQNTKIRKYSLPGRFFKKLLSKKV